MKVLAARGIIWLPSKGIFEATDCLAFAQLGPSLTLTIGLHTTTHPPQVLEDFQAT